MTVYRQHRHTRYTIVPNDALERDDLSWKAKGLLAYLLSRPDNWEARVGQLVTASSDGRYSVLDARRELVDAGYLVEQRCRNAAGQLHTVTHVFDTPGHTPDELPDPDATDSDDTGVGFPDPGTGVGFPDVGKPDSITTTEPATTEKDLKESAQVRPSGRTPKEPARRKERRLSSPPRGPRSQTPPPKDHSGDAWQLARYLFAALSERDLGRINALSDVEHKWVVRDVLDAWEDELSHSSFDELDGLWFAHDDVDGTVEFDVYRWAGIGKVDNIGAVLAWRIRNADDAQWDGAGESCYLEPHDVDAAFPPVDGRRDPYADLPDHDGYTANGIPRCMAERKAGQRCLTGARRKRRRVWPYCREHLQAFGVPAPADEDEQCRAAGCTDWSRANKATCRYHDGRW